MKIFAYLFMTCFALEAFCEQVLVCNGIDLKKDLGKLNGGFSYNKIVNKGALTPEERGKVTTTVNNFLNSMTQELKVDIRWQGYVNHLKRIYKDHSDLDVEREFALVLLSEIDGNNRIDSYLKADGSLDADSLNPAHSRRLFGQRVNRIFQLLQEKQNEENKQKTIQTLEALDTLTQIDEKASKYLQELIDNFGTILAGDLVQQIQIKLEFIKTATEKLRNLHPNLAVKPVASKKAVDMINKAVDAKARLLALLNLCLNNVIVEIYKLTNDNAAKLAGMNEKLDLAKAKVRQLEEAQVVLVSANRKLANDLVNMSNKSIRANADLAQANADLENAKADLENAKAAAADFAKASKEDLKKIYYAFGCTVYLLESASRQVDGKVTLLPQDMFKEYNLPESILNGIKDDEKERFEWELYWSLPPELTDVNKIGKIVKSEWNVDNYRILTPNERAIQQGDPTGWKFMKSDIPPEYSKLRILGSEDNYPKAIDPALK